MLEDVELPSLFSRRSSSHCEDIFSPYSILQDFADTLISLRKLHLIILVSSSSSSISMKWLFAPVNRQRKKSYVWFKVSCLILGYNYYSFQFTYCYDL